MRRDSVKRHAIVSQVEAEIFVCLEKPTGNERALQDLIRREDPTVVLLQETKVKARRWMVLKAELVLKEVFGFFFFYGRYGVDCEGQSGGLMSLWRTSVELHIESFSKHHIHVVISVEQNQMWSITGVYGHLETLWRDETWELIKRLHSTNHNP